MDDVLQFDDSRYEVKTCTLQNRSITYRAYKGIENHYCGVRCVKTEQGLRWIPQDGDMTEKQIALSKELKKLFPAYLNSLKLKDRQDNLLTLDEGGEGSFKEYVRGLLLESAQRELDTHDSAKKLADFVVAGSEVEKQPFISIHNNKAAAIDWDEFVRKITRMKTTPAFDALDLKSPENEEFGTEYIEGKHFTIFSKERSEVSGEIADAKIIKMMNPIRYIGNADTAKHWRIRHGVFDRDTSLAIPAILI